MINLQNYIFFRKQQSFLPKNILLTFFSHCEGIKDGNYMPFFIQSEQVHFIIHNEKLKVILTLKPLKDAEFF